jgi:hypothetical protein
MAMLDLIVIDFCTAFVKRILYSSLLNEDSLSFGVASFCFSMCMPSPCFVLLGEVSELSILVFAHTHYAT